jgi:hypothetical protein
MGQRLLITEDEKKYIKSLYEDKTLLPPSESILIDNKNPFKHLEYKDAQREYSSNLKDGDRFYEIKFYNFHKFIDNFFADLYRSFVGKTIRINSEDEIAKIEEFFIKELQVEFESSDKGIKNVTISFRYKIGLFTYRITISYNNGKFGPIISLREEYRSSSPKLTLPEELITSTNQIDLYRAFNSIGEQMKKKCTEILNNLQNIPDDCFEIRQIQREKTDF